MLAVCSASQAQSLRDFVAAADLRDDEVYIDDVAEGWGAFFNRLFGRREAFDKSYAVVIGVNKYDSGWSQLSAAEKDPLRMRDYLIGRARFDGVITLTNERATKGRIQYLMQDVFPELVGSRDRLLVYFSGHGTQREIGGGVQGYLPLTASGRSYSRMISMGEVQAWDGLLRDAKQVLFLIDSCFSGLAGIQPKSAPEMLPIDRLTGYGHHLISAGTGNQETIASESRWGGSIFTDSFLRGIAGGADTSTSEFERDGVVSLVELEEYISRRVQRETAGLDYRITPQVYDLSGDNEGEFFFITEEHERQVEPPHIPAPLDVITQGDAPPTLSSTRIRQVQEMLTELGFAPGAADGILGARTRAAIIAFQRSIGIAATDGQLTVDVEIAIAKAHAEQGKEENRDWTSGIMSAVIPPSLPSFEAEPAFQECPNCPEMVIIPAGSFMMGSPENEEGQSYGESPQREEKITSPFALGKYEVTFDQWDACFDAGGCNHKPKDESWGRGLHPVINVSWDDAQEYVRWLSKETEYSYRLPSEMEWEYAARAGTKTRYSVGENLRPDQANFGSKEDRTVTVGRYKPNAFGLYDMHGNVWEWVDDGLRVKSDEWPEDPMTWLPPNYPAHRLRGGGWDSGPDGLRSASRSWSKSNSRNNDIGFRVARTLTP